MFQLQYTVIVWPKVWFNHTMLWECVYCISQTAAHTSLCSSVWRCWADARSVLQKLNYAIHHWITLASYCKMGLAALSEGFETAITAKWRQPQINREPSKLAAYIKTTTVSSLHCNNFYPLSNHISTKHYHEILKVTPHPLNPWHRYENLHLSSTLHWWWFISVQLIKHSLFHNKCGEDAEHPVKNTAYEIPEYILDL